MDNATIDYLLLFIDYLLWFGACQGGTGIKIRPGVDFFFSVNFNGLTNLHNQAHTQILKDRLPSIMSCDFMASTISTY